MSPRPPESSEIVRRAAFGPVTEGATLPRSTLATADPIPDAWGVRRLVVEEGAVDLSRAEGGLPILIAHDGAQLPIGRVEDVRIEDGRLRGTPVLSGATATARDAAALVADGTVRALSIRATVDASRTEIDEDGAETVHVTRWTPLEASLVAVPGDPSAGIGRAHTGGPAMTGTATTTTTPDPLAAELERQQTIIARRNDLCASIPTIADEVRRESDAMLLDRTVTAESALSRFLAMIPAAAPAAGPGAGTATGGSTEIQRFVDGATEALCIRAGVGTFDAATIAANEFTSYSQVEIARHWLERSGIDTRGMTRMDIVGKAMVSRGVDTAANTTTADYPSILANVMNKSLFSGFDENPRTWDQFCSIGSSSDFKPFTRPGLSAFTDLVQVAENAAFTDGIRVDKHEGGTIATYGRVYSYTRQAQVNDDLGAFSTNGRSMGEAASRLIDTLPYTILTTNPLMTEDGVALFAAGHNNLGTAAMTETSINDMKVAMLRQADQNAIQVAPRLTYLIGPPELSQTAEKLLSDQQLPVSVGSGAAREHNTVAGRYTWVESEHLSDANDWFGAARKGQTIEVVFLEGRQQPTLEMENAFSVDAIHMKVRHDAVAFALDWRGLASEVVA